MPEKFSPLLIDNDDQSIAESDPLIKQAVQKRQAAIWEITRELQNVTYSGTQSRQEQEELEVNMLSLIDEKKHSYKYIEQLLVSLGYNLNKVRHAFKKLTGLSPEEFLSPDAYLDTPPTIPGFNNGWGESKDASFDYYFVMPYKHGYAVFGQKGDLVREEVKYVFSLDEALEFITKKVKELNTYDRIVDVKVNKKPIRENDETYTKVNLDYVGARTAALEDHIKSIQFFSQPREIRAILENALNKKLVTAEEFQKLVNRYINAKTASEMDFEEKLMKQPIKKELSEITPQQFFNNEAKDDFGDGAKMGDVIDSILTEMKNTNNDLVNYEVAVRSFKYIDQSLAGSKIVETPSVGVQKAEEYFNSSGVVSVLFYVTAENLPEDKNTKPGLILFSLEDGALHTSGVFKGKDDKSYALNESGFDSYFVTEKESVEK
jgi:hypothetical protein